MILRNICLFQETNRTKIFLVDYIKKNMQYKEKKFHSHVIQKKKIDQTPKNTSL